MSVRGNEKINEREKQKKGKTEKNKGGQTL